MFFKIGAQIKRKLKESRLNFKPMLLLKSKLLGLNAAKCNAAFRGGTVNNLILHFLSPYFPVTFHDSKEK